MNGTILGKSKNDYIIQTNDSRPNRNNMVIGNSGSFKTQAFVITNVLYETENSIVVTDPKGEIYQNTADFKEKQGYKVHVVNFDKMAHSDRYNPLDYVHNDVDATKVATKIVDSGNKDGKKDVWYYSQRQFLSALIIYVVMEEEPQYRNMKGVVKFLQENNDNGSEDDDSVLDKTFSNLEDNHPAKKLYELGYKNAKGQMRASIISSLLATISNYVNETVAEFTSFSDFDLKSIGKKEDKTIVYLIISIMDKSFEGLTNLFLTQLFEQLYELGSENNSKLPRQVDFILDEFVNLGKFDNYEEFLATNRGYGIGVSTILQSITQLIDRYNKEKAQSIMGNCATQICLGAEKETAKYFSERLGKTTIKVETSNKSNSTNTGQKDGGSTSHSDNESFSQRDLMTADEVANMPDDDQLIVFSNRPPLRTQKAKQFEIFPDPVMKSQLEYQSQPEQSQVDKFNEQVKEYNANKDDKEQERKEREEQRNQETKEEQLSDIESQMMTENLTYTGDDSENFDEEKDEDNDVFDDLDNTENFDESEITP